MKFHGFELNKSLSELRASPYHQQLGRTLRAAFIAQQQGTRLDTAHNFNGQTRRRKPTRSSLP